MSDAQAGPTALPAPRGPAGGAVVVAAPSGIAGRYEVDFGRPLADAGGGQPAFATLDRASSRPGLMAVQVRPDAPARAAALTAAMGAVIEGEPGLLMPLAHGPAAGPGGLRAWFVICTAPPGPAVWPTGQPTIRAWSEAELLRCLVRPAAAALEELRLRELTHRAIRPDNLFRAGAGDPVVLGCPWAAPPAFLQPPAFEPPYVAMCLPSGRGEGTTADDVYALGVTTLALALGRMPWAGLGDDDLIRRKLDAGSFAALVGEARLTPGLVDLLRNMLAEDPVQRPSLALLADPAAARARRVAARPPRRASRPLAIGGAVAWDARQLGFAIARDPAAGVHVLRLGVVDHWLRRGLDDAVLAARLEEQTRRRQAEAGADDANADAVLAMRATALLDPLAPLCWDGLALWPDGLGPALAVQSEPGVTERLERLVAVEATANFAALRTEAKELAPARQRARTQRGVAQRRGWAGGLARLRYELNPLLACRSPALGGALVVRLSDLLPALEAAAARAGPAAGTLLDAEQVAFVAARQENELEAQLAEFGEGRAAPQAVLTPLRLLARLQQRTHAAPLPHLGAALADAARPTLVGWHSRTTREAKAEALIRAAASGNLSALLAVLDDPAARTADDAGLAHATATIARIDAELAALAGGGAARQAAARALGREIAAGAGLAALAASTAAAVLG
jgi:hypothetical protein